MPFNFPASPTVGEVSDQYGVDYVWSGVAWERAPAVVSHAATHATGGSDAITPASIGAATSGHSHAASAITEGVLDDARLSANVVRTSDTRLASNGTKGDITVSNDGATWAINADAVTTADIADAAVTDQKIATLAASKLTGTVDDARLTANVVLTSDARLSDARLPTSHASSHTSGGSDALTLVSTQISDFSTAARSAAATKTVQCFTARDNNPPASNFATLDTRNSVLVLEYDAATEESATFIGVVTENLTLASGLAVRLWWMADTATTGNVRWGVQFERTGTDLDADSYDANAQVTSAANATSGVESVASITITSIDSLAAGDRFRLRVYRVAADATNDTMTGDAQLVAVEVRAA